jgi:hypothetical protein
LKNRCAARVVVESFRPKTWTCTDGGAIRASLPRDRGYHQPTGGDAVTVWFTVQLDDKPGALARVATALAERSVNIAGIVGIAEDTNGELMLETSDPAATRQVFDALGISYQEHDATGGLDPGNLSVSDVRGRSPRPAR